jgi:hypothetical protein
MKRRLTLLVSLFLVVILSAQADWLQHRRKAFRVVDGPNVWYDAVAPGSTNNGTGVSTEGNTFAGKVVVTTGGTATKVRIYCEFMNDTAASVKVGLFDLSGNRLGSGSRTLSGLVNDAYVEVTLSVSATVTSATTYYVGWMCSNGVGFTGRYLSGQPSGTSGDNFTETYAGFPSASVSWGSLPWAIAVGIYVD